MWVCVDSCFDSCSELLSPSAIQLRKVYPALDLRNLKFVRPHWGGGGTRVCCGAVNERLSTSASVLQCADEKGVRSAFGVRESNLIPRRVHEDVLSLCHPPVCAVATNYQRVFITPYS